MESDNPLSQAITAHQQGKLDEAEHLYREILKIEPKLIFAQPEDLESDLLNSKTAIT